MDPDKEIQAQDDTDKNQGDDREEKAERTMEAAEVESKDGELEIDVQEMNKKIKEKMKLKRVDPKGLVQRGIGIVLRSGDFFGRLGTLLVMLVSSSNTVTILVTSIIEEVYWRAAIHAGLLLFVHIPVIAVMIWLMCKTRFMAIYHRVRPRRGKEPEIVVASAELVDETVVVTGESEKPDADNTEKPRTERKEERKVPATQRKVGVSEKEKDSRLEKRALEHARRGQHINRAFQMGGL